MAKSNKAKTIKDEVLQGIKDLPDNCSLEDIQYYLYVREKIGEGLADAEKGNVIPHDEAKRRMEAWLRSRGLRRPSASGKR
jgi:hypothetical protein